MRIAALALLPALLPACWSGASSKGEPAPRGFVASAAPGASGAFAAGGDVKPPEEDDEYRPMPPDEEEVPEEPMDPLDPAPSTAPSVPDGMEL